MRNYFSDNILVLVYMTLRTNQQEIYIMLTRPIALTCKCTYKTQYQFVLYKNQLKNYALSIFNGIRNEEILQLVNPLKKYKNN